MREWGNGKSGGVSTNIARFSFRAIIALAAILLAVGYGVYRLVS